MGRAGGGGSHSGGFGGGGHISSGHSGGGHRASFGGSSRAGSSASRTSSRSSSGGMGEPFFSTRRSASPPIIINNGRGMGLGGTMGCGSFGCSGCLVGVVAVVIILVIFSLMMSNYAAPARVESVNTSDIPASSYNREKLEDTSWSNDCVVDEIGWISEDGSVSGLERQLREFFDKTGVQPYVYLVGYRPELTSDSDKAKFASDYYEEEIGNGYTFAFFYFEEANPDDVGYMYYEGGSQALGVMDAEAVDIFWRICDQEWYGDATTEDAIANTFNRTADRIMTKTATKNDITKIVLIIVLVIVVAVVIIIIMNQRRKHERERNEETKKILETPLE